MFVQLLINVSTAVGRLRDEGQPYIRASKFMRCQFQSTSLRSILIAPWCINKSGGHKDPQTNTGQSEMRKWSDKYLNKLLTEMHYQ
jgi:hypothetical protein